MWTYSYTLEQMGSFIQECRQSKGIRQDDFARRLGVSHTTLSNLECGKNTSTQTLQQALSHLGLKMVIVPKTATVTVADSGEERLG